MRFNIQTLLNIGVIIAIVFLLSQNEHEKSIATVDLKAITQDFASFAIHSGLSEDKLETLADLFSKSLDSNLKALSHDYHILSKSAVVTKTIDITEDLKSRISSDISGAI